jgi:hypothetical protein
MTFAFLPLECEPSCEWSACGFSILVAFIQLDSLQYSDKDCVNDAGLRGSGTVWVV